MIIISNGLGHFHLRQAAEAAFESNALRIFVTGAYPKGPLWGNVAKLPAARLQRLAGRGASLPDQLVSTSSVPDVFNQLAGQAMRRPWLRPAYESISANVLRAYQRRLVGVLRAHGRPCDVFHYRAGYSGKAALEVARSKGMFLLCDHSIAHPQVLSSLARGNGMTEVAAKDQLGPFWEQVMGDIDLADHVVVNSHFVRDTFARVGESTERVSVVYTLPEDNFVTPKELARGSSAGAKLRVLFAGTLNERKGLHDLEKIIKASSSEILFELVGLVDVQLASVVGGLEKMGNVQVLGVRPRSELSRRMRDADVFLFPSRAEGSARVVAEAMSSNCAVLTTVESGSLLPKDDWQVSGSGDWSLMAGKLRQLSEDKKLVQQLATRNALVLEQYRETSYGDRLRDVYDLVRELQR